MAVIAKLRVQIAPVGFEIDRVVLPAKQEKADTGYGCWFMRIRAMTRQARLSKRYQTG